MLRLSAMPVANVLLIGAQAAQAATPDGGGYWTLSGNGGAFAYGDAPNKGDISSVDINRSVIAGTGF